MVLYAELDATMSFLCAREQITRTVASRSSRIYSFYCKYCAAHILTYIYIKLTLIKLHKKERTTIAPKRVWSTRGSGGGAGQTQLRICAEWVHSRNARQQHTHTHTNACRRRHIDSSSNAILYEFWR